MVYSVKYILLIFCTKSLKVPPVEKDIRAHPLYNILQQSDLKLMFSTLIHGFVVIIGFDQVPLTLL